MYPSPAVSLCSDITHATLRGARHPDRNPAGRVDGGAVLPRGWSAAGCGAALYRATVPTTATDDDVDLAARRFRGACERLERPGLPGLQYFPKGACGDTSRLLAQYLRECGLGESTLVTGWRVRAGMRCQSHAWLERDGVIVDLTADQFDQPPIIVTRSSTWHGSWPEQQRHSHRVGLDYYSPTSAADHDYRRLRDLADDLYIA
jgi:hypothetical protein